VTDYSTQKVLEFIRTGLDKTLSNKARGDALEDLVCYLLEELPGVKTKRNVIDRSRNCEVDVIVANCQHGWMTQYPKHFFVECKNWDTPADSKVLRDFAMKMEDRYVEVGVLVTANGITGNPTDLTAAHQEIVIQQAKGRRIIVVTLEEIKLVATTEDFELLLLECLMATVGLTRR
jgi:Restriction endonuclease